MTLVGLAELAEMFGVTKQVIANWRARKESFPEPIAQLKAGPVWDVDACREWAKDEGVELASGRSASSGKAHAKVAALMNMKGGVGKSTLTANLGWYAAYQKNLKVLLVDLDPQFNLSQYILGIKEYEDLIRSGKPTIESLFSSAPGSVRPRIKEIVQRTKNWNDGSCLHLLPAKLDLAWIIRNAPRSANLLRDNLEDLKDAYDLILVDCAPTDSVLSDAAYMAADYMFVPVRPEFLSAIGLPLLLDSQERFMVDNPNATLPVFGGVIFNDTGDKAEHEKARKYVRSIAAEHDLYVLQNEISHSDSYPTGSRTATPIFLTENARSWKKAEFTRVANEFLQRMGL